MLSIGDNHPEITVVTQLRGYLAQIQLPDDGRLPPERELAAALGVSRTELRKALDVLESEGQLWRHVGKGTFVGSRPLDTFADITDVPLVLPEGIDRLGLLFAGPLDDDQIGDIHARMTSTDDADQAERAKIRAAVGAGATNLAEMLAARMLGDPVPDAILPE